jgi:broad specificity phosphatase PhoE
MLTLYVTRHGETEWNIENRMQGHKDSELTSYGLSQTLALRKNMEDIIFDKILASPSGRTLHTAELLRHERPILIEKDDRLKEIGLGHWEGLTHEEIKGIDPIQFRNFWDHPPLYENTNGESFLQVMDRVQGFLEELYVTHAAGNLLVVTHGVVLKIMMLIFNNRPIARLWEPPFIENNKLVIIQRDCNKKYNLVEKVQ